MNVPLRFACTAAACSAVSFHFFVFVLSFFFAALCLCISGFDVASMWNMWLMNEFFADACF